MAQASAPQGHGVAEKLKPQRAGRDHPQPLSSLASRQPVSPSARQPLSLSAPHPCIHPHNVTTSAPKAKPHSPNPKYSAPRVFRPSAPLLLSRPVLVLGLVLALSSSAPGASAQQQELRFASVSWIQVGEYEVEFTVESAWTKPNGNSFDALQCVHCQGGQPAIGDVLKMRDKESRDPSLFSVPNRFIFGDEHLYNGNGTQLQRMMVSDEVDNLLWTIATTRHKYPEQSDSKGIAFRAALQGCCRTWTELVNHKDYGWDVPAQVVLSPHPWGSEVEPWRSPIIPWVPYVSAERDVHTEFSLKGLDMTKTMNPGNCKAGDVSGCRISYEMLQIEGSGINYTLSGTPYAPPHADIAMDFTGRISLPASVSADMTADGKVVSLVVEASASAPGPLSHMKVSAGVDFAVVFQSAPVPRVGSPTPLSAVEWQEPQSDPSTGVSIDFVCEYLRSYTFNASAPVEYMQSPRLINFTEFGLNLTGLPDPSGSRAIISWNAPCSKLGFKPLCFRACEGVLCSAPLCHRFEVRGDCIQGHSIFVAPTPGVLPEPPLTLRVGETLNLTVRADGQPLGNYVNQFNYSSMIGASNPNVLVRVPDRTLGLLSNPGLPNGASIGPNVNEGDHAVHRTVIWQPTNGQEGLFYEICFEAFSNTKPAHVCHPRRHCVQVMVLEPLQIIEEIETKVEPPAAFMDESMPEGQQVLIAPGCLVTLSIKVSRGQYVANLTAEETVGIPPGSTLTQVSVGMVPDMDGRYEDTWELTWRPSRDFLMPEYPACLLLTDTLMAASGPKVNRDPRREVRCVTYVMQRCRACAEAGQSLQHIAAYWWGADWIQMWGSNPEISTPDRLPSEILLRLGPTYHVKVLFESSTDAQTLRNDESLGKHLVETPMPLNLYLLKQGGDTLSRLAARFGMSLGALRKLNPDVTGDSLFEGQPLCTMPTVCPEQS